MSRRVEKQMKITYPPGCKEINEELSNEELLKRLKVLAKAFQDMAQDNCDFKDLAIYLASEFFLDHSQKDVKLLVACCIADIFRVFVPDAPYTDPMQLKEIFLFLIEQLKGLKDITSPSFKRYFYLLENLAWVKSFNISLELMDSSEILFKLFKTTFELVNEQHVSKVSVFILDILCPMLSEADGIPQEVLDIFLSCLIEPFKSQNRPAYEMARDLIKRTSSVLEPYIEMFFSNCLIQSHKSEKSSLSSRVYDLIQEFNVIAPSMLQNILPQLELKLKSSDDSERMAATKMLSKMFSAPNSDLALKHKQLWSSYLSRFNDIDLNIRRLVTQSCQEIIVHHPELITDAASGRGITECLKLRQHDSDENVRMDVVKTIVQAAKTELRNVPNELLDCVKERTLDKKFKVRREALVGLGQIYKKCYENDGDISKIGWIRNKILHTYYQNTIDDKILVERILNTSLVPYFSDPPARMKQLYRLYSNLDEHAVRALHEIFKTQFGLRNVIKSILELQQKPDSGDISQALSSKILGLSKHLPEPEKATQQLQKFFKLISETKLKSSLLNLVSPQCSCKKAEEYVKEIIRKLGNNTPQNLMYSTVKQLLERAAPVMIDNLSILALTMHVEEVIQSRTVQDIDEGLTSTSGLKLLLLLSIIFPVSFQMQEVYSCLLKFIKCDDSSVVDVTMQILKNIGPGIESTFPDIHSSLLPVLQKMIKIGTVKQAKHAIRCIDALCKDKEQIFTQLYEQLEKSMNFESSNFLTSVVAIGHLAQLCPSQFAAPTEAIISKFIFQELLMQDRTVGEKCDEDWCDDESVSQETQAKIQSLKMIVRWLLGVRNNNNSRVTPTLRMLYSMVLCEGDLMELGRINKPEMARLRLQAGCCMLKLAQESVYAEAIKLEQFETMALLINDPCVEVRQQFVTKLHKGLMNLRLPIQYMGILCLGALDPNKDRRTIIKQMLSANINRRRDYIRQNPSCATSCSVFSVLPDYVIPYAVHLLAHDPDFKAVDDVNALRSIRDCLLFLIDPLLCKNDTVSFNFYSKMLENIKNTTDAQYPEPFMEANIKLYTVCDLAMNLLLSKMSSFTLTNFPADPILPCKLYKQPDQDFVNTKTYISAELLSQINRSKKGMPIKSEQKNSSHTSEHAPSKNKSVDSSVSSSPPPSPVSSNKSSAPELRGNKLKSARGMTKAQGGSVFVDSAEITSTRSKSSEASGKKDGASVDGKRPRRSVQSKLKPSEKISRKKTPVHRKENSDDDDDEDGHGGDDSKDENIEEGSAEMAEEEDDDNDGAAVEDDNDDECASSTEFETPVKKLKRSSTRRSKVLKQSKYEKSDSEIANEGDVEEFVKSSSPKKKPATSKTNQTRRKSARRPQKAKDDDVGDEDDEESNSESNNNKNANKPKSSSVPSRKSARRESKKTTSKAKQDESEGSNKSEDDNDVVDEKEEEEEEEEESQSIPSRGRKRKANPSGGSSASKKSKQSHSNGSSDSVSGGSSTGKKTKKATKNAGGSSSSTRTKVTMAAKRREGAAARAAKKYQDFEVTSPTKKK